MDPAPYFSRRARDERLTATDASREQSRQAHVELSFRYEQLASGPFAGSIAQEPAAGPPNDPGSIAAPNSHACWSAPFYFPAPAHLAICSSHLTTAPIGLADRNVAWKPTYRTASTLRASEFFGREAVGLSS